MKKFISFTATLVFSLLIYAQEAVQFNFTFNHMAFSVKDVNASADFYKKVFQFTDMPNRSAIEGIRWLSMGEDKELHLISIVKEPVMVNKGVHLAVATRQMDEFIKHLDKLKIEFYDFAMKPHTVNMRADGVKQIYFKDPDGYWIEVNNGYTAAQTKTTGSIVGTWRLVEFADMDSVTHEWKYRYGKNPRGYFTYTKNGILNLNISSDNPPKISEDSAKHHNINLLDFIDHIALGYFGTYTVDEKNSTVIHHVKGGSILWYTDTDQPRRFQLDGDTLTIGDNKTWKRVLVRVD
jgi:catechol 2,3-dioxygenase-like lactoylglutathione lyase family enzyme